MNWPNNLDIILALVEKKREIFDKNSRFNVILTLSMTLFPSLGKF